MQKKTLASLLVVWHTELLICPHWLWGWSLPTVSLTVGFFMRTENRCPSYRCRRRPAVFSSRPGNGNRMSASRSRGTPSCQRLFSEPPPCRLPSVSSVPLHGILQSKTLHRSLFQILFCTPHRQRPAAFSQAFSHPLPHGIGHTAQQKTKERCHHSPRSHHRAAASEANPTSQRDNSSDIVVVLAGRLCRKGDSINESPKFYHWFDAYPPVPA